MLILDEPLGGLRAGRAATPSAIEDGPRLEPGAKGPEVEALQAMLASYGYGLDISGLYDTMTQSAITAFQRHFRPALVDGIADDSTITTLRRLLGSLTNG